MAIVKGPALSLEASGNLGAICYSKYRSLQIARGVWTGTVPNTTKQIVQQGHMTVVSQAWGGTLDTAERLTWSNLAQSIKWRDRLGSTYVPTGYQLFMKWNIRRRVMGLAIMILAPSVQEWVHVGFLNVVVEFARDRIGMNLRETFAQVILGYGTEYYKAGPFNSGGRKPIEGEWLFLDRKAPPSQYIDYNLIGGKWYWYRGRAISKFGGVQNWFQEQVQFI